MRKKIIILVTASVLVSLASLGALSYFFVRDSVNRSFEDHALMASMLGREIDYGIELNISRLMDIYISGQVDPSRLNTEEAKQALRTVYKYSMFSDGVFLVDRLGNVILNYPYRSSELGSALDVPVIDKALFDGQIAVSDVYTDDRTGRKFIYVIVPLKDHDGTLAGALGGRIDPTNYVFSQVIKDAASENEVIELVDSRGAVIASNQMDRVLTMSDHNRFMEGLVAAGKKDIVRCHRCHEGAEEDKPKRADILAFAPLSTAPWGVAVRMPEEAAYRPTVGLIRAILAIGVMLIASALFLAAGLSRSIADPVRLLTDATRKIASGEMDIPVRVEGEDEIGELADSLEVMRDRLDRLVKESIHYSSMLEEEVAQRTQEVVLSKRQLASLLDELIAAQEDERKRIAQELHDDTSQTIAALGMSIDIAVHALDSRNLTPKMLMELREKVSDLLDDIGRIIKNLRPSVLDDLGLESAIEWMLDRQLKPRGMSFFIDAEGIGPGVFSKQEELSVFRMLQEALNNVIKHSEATHVSVIIKRIGVEVNIEVIDNGVGFDVDEAKRNHGPGGFGLLGIRERVQQMGGEFEIVSTRGEGTGLYITVPARGMGAEVA